MADRRAVNSGRARHRRRQAREAVVRDGRRPRHRRRVADRGARRAPRPCSDALVGPRAASSSDATRAARARRSRRRVTRGIVEAGGTAVLAGVLPTPAVALLAQDLGLVVSASHNPPEYNGVKVFDRDGHKLTDADELEIEALLDAAGPGGGAVEHAEDATGGLRRAHRRALRLRSERPADRRRLRQRRVLGDRARRVRAPRRRGDGARERAGRDEHQRRLRRHRPRDAPLGGRRRRLRPRDRLRRRRRPDARRRRRPARSSTATRSSPICALALGVDSVVVTTMTNMGFHRLMAEHGIRVVTTDVGDRYVLEALRAEGGILGGEQSGHVIVLDGHVTGDGLAAALMLCRSLGGRTLAEAAARMPRFAQAKENIVVAEHGRAAARDRRGRAAERASSTGAGRVLVRPSGTEPLIRVLAEAESAEEAAELCASIAELVRREAREPVKSLQTGCPSGEGARLRRSRRAKETSMCGIIGYVGPRECKRAASPRPRAPRVPRATTRPGSRCSRTDGLALHAGRRQPPEPEAARPA